MILLLVAIIAAIALTLRQRKDTKYVNPPTKGPGSRRAQVGEDAVVAWHPSPKPPAPQRRRQ